MNDKQIVQLDFGFDIEPVSKQNNKYHTEVEPHCDFVLDFMDCFTSPTIVFKSAWEDSIPSDILKNIRMSRILCMLSGEKMASLTEVVAYMMPRTFEAPLPPEWVHIYIWAGLQHAKSFKKGEQLKTMAEIAPEELSDYELGLLNNLRRWIYQQRRSALKRAMKIEKSYVLQETSESQQGLFDK